MFKKTLLTLTALTAISLAQAPHVSTADAAVKIKPATVKLKTKIRVAKPKVRVKIKKARVRVKLRKKVRVRVKKKVRVKAAKVRVKKAKTRTKAAKLDLGPQVHGINPVKPKPIRIRTVRPVVKVKPDVAKMAKGRRVSSKCANYRSPFCKAPHKNANPQRIIPASAQAKVESLDTSKLRYKVTGRSPADQRHAGGLPGNRPDGARNRASATITGLPSFKYPDPVFLADASRFAEIGQVASLAEDLKNLQDALRVAGHGNGELDMLFTPFNPGGETPSEPEAPGGDGPFGKGPGLGDPAVYGAGIRVAGVGASVFGFLSNNHSKDTPSHSLGVNVAAAIAGVANGGGTLEQDPDSVTKAPSADGHGVIVTKDNSADAETHHVRIVSSVEYRDSGYVHVSRTEHIDGHTIYWHADYESRDDYRRRNDSAAGGIITFRNGEERTWGDLAELSNPDYVAPGGCQSMDCILNGRKPKGLTKTDMTPGGLPPAPEETVHTGEPTAPLYTANDVLERYDPDAKDNGSGSRGKDSVLPGGFPEDPNS